LARVIRDIPVSYVYAGNDVPNLRQLLEEQMKKEGLKCRCIRCREVRKKITSEDTIVNIRDYEASGGHEYFISIESKDKETIYGFCRLRLSNNMGFIKSGGHKESNNKIDEDINLFPYLNNMAMIRELHVYGVMTPLNKTKNNKTQDASHQHKGYGKILIKVAENIAIKNNFHKIGVISGVGVRKYYEKLGYSLENNYMVRELDFYEDINKPVLYVSIVVVIYCVFVILTFFMSL
jgi:elongator complex protein 3